MSEPMTGTEAMLRALPEVSVSEAMDDLVRRLRDPRYKGQEGMRREAADTIERLRFAIEFVVRRRNGTLDTGNEQTEKT